MTTRGTSHHRRFLLVLFALALTTRLAVGVVTQAWLIPPDEDHWEFGYEMGRIAGSIVSGDGFSYPTRPPTPTAWMAPGYPYFLAVIFKLLGPFTPQAAAMVFALQTLASAGSCVLLVVLSRAFFDPLTSRLSGLLLALYPASIHFSVQKIWSTTFFSTLLVLIVILFVSCSRSPTPRRCLVLGLCCGLAMLLNPVFLSVCAMLLLWLAWSWRRHATGTAGSLMLLMASLLLVITPWLMRNYFVFGRFVLIKSNFGHELLVGNHDLATGLLPSEVSGIERKLRDLDGPLPDVDLGPAETSLISSLNEAESNRLFLKMARESIARHPLNFIQRSARRFFRFWTFNRAPQISIDLVSHVAYFGVLFSALIGIVIAVRERSRVVVPLLIPIVVFPCVYYVAMVGLYRYRFPVEPFLIVFAAYAISRLVPHDRGPLARVLQLGDPASKDARPTANRW